MLKILVFAAFAAASIAAAMWVADRPGAIMIEWLDYTIKMDIGIFLLCLFAAALVLFLVSRLFWSFVDLPAAWQRYRRLRRRQKGLRALTLGFSATAAGDAKHARYHAFRARRMMDEGEGLNLLLQAQAARLRGDTGEARRLYQNLLADGDTRFLGLRGLLVDAVERQDTGEARALAMEALKLAPKQVWILRLAFDLTARMEDWPGALSLLERWQNLSDKKDAPHFARDRAALLVAMGDDFYARGHTGRANRHYKKAFVAAPDFTPAGLSYARFLVRQDKKRAARKAIETAWQAAPHPGYVAFWKALERPEDQKETRARLQWFEKLVALRPGHPESHAAAAAASLDLGQWESARNYIEQLEREEDSVRLYRLRAHLADGMGQDMEARRHMQAASVAPPDKTWVCRETGAARHEGWAPVFEERFNTLEWCRPGDISSRRAAIGRDSAPPILIGAL